MKQCLGGNVTGLRSLSIYDNQDDSNFDKTIKKILHVVCKCINISALTALHKQHNPFIQAISIAPLQVRYYSEALPTQHGYCPGVSHQSTTDNWVKDLPKVPTWQLERDSNPRLSGRKASTLPMLHHIPQ